WRRTSALEEPAHVGRGIPALRGGLQERRHLGPLIEEEPDIATGFGQADRAIERAKGAVEIAGRMASERVDDEDLQDAPGPTPLLRRGEQAPRAGSILEILVV